MVDDVLACLDGRLSRRGPAKDKLEEAPAAMADCSPGLNCAGYVRPAAPVSAEMWLSLSLCADAVAWRLVMVEKPSNNKALRFRLRPAPRLR